MTSTLQVAAVQMSATQDPTENLAQIRAYAASAADAGADLVVFPEAAMARFGTHLNEVAEPLDGPFADGVRTIAEEYGVLVVAGMFTPAGEDAEGGSQGPRGRRVHNTLLATGRGVEASYRKIHLFDAFGSRESDTVAPGDEHVVLEALGTRIGLTTCYDVRFADQFTALGRAGAEVVVLPASWGDGPAKAEQWDLLCRARAMDAQAWLLAADQAWSPPIGRAPLGVGRSMLVDPNGVVRAQLDAAEGLLAGRIDLELVAATRERVPVLG